MPILYGKARIPFRRFTPAQANLQAYYSEEVVILAEQNVAYIFLIPVFGMGKEYYFKKDGKKYILPHDHEMQLLESVKIRTPVFAATLPILILLAIAWFLGTSLFHQNPYEKFEKLRFNRTLEEINYALGHLDEHHFIKLVDLTQYSTPDLYLKVVKADDQQVECQIMQTNQYDLEEKKYLVEKLYHQFKDGLKTVQVSRADLESAVCRDYSRYQKNRRPGVDLLKKGVPYFIESIDYLDGPNIESYIFNTENMDGFQIQLKNVGQSATLTRIETANNNITWTTPLPSGFPGGFSNENNLFLRCNASKSNKMQDIVLFLQDTLGREHTFVVKASRKYCYTQRSY